MILTLPSLFVIVFSSISGRLSTVMSKKILILIGLVLFIVGGMAPAVMLSGSLSFILIMRAVLGIGLGICMPFTTGLIADFFERDEQSNLLGFQSSVVNIGGIVTSIIAGVLAALS